MGDQNAVGTLHKDLAALLVLIAAALAANHFGPSEAVPLAPPVRLVAGSVAGLLIGGVAALMGVAGGELLIPTIVLLHGVDIMIAGSLSLTVSLPTMLVAFTRYSRDRSFLVLSQTRPARGLDCAWLGDRHPPRWPSPRRRP